MTHPFSPLLVCSMAQGEAVLLNSDFVIRGSLLMSLPVPRISNPRFNSQTPLSWPTPSCICISWPQLTIETFERFVTQLGLLGWSERPIPCDHGDRGHPPPPMMQRKGHVLPRPAVAFSNDSLGLPTMAHIISGVESVFLLGRC